MSEYTPDTLAKIRQAEKALSTREEVQNNFTMIMQPYGNVEDLISPAPLSIALLGQLILLSLQTDLSLMTKDNKEAPKYLTHPTSLRASLLQVSHSGWDAFDLAHKNMDAIRQKTANVPDYVNDSVKIIIGGTKDEMEVVLPKALKNIKRIAGECTKKAKDVEESFVLVMQIISELLQYCTAKRGDHEREIKENKAALQAAGLAKEQMENEQEMADEYLSEMKEIYKQTREDYDKALDDMPGTMSLIGLSLVEKAASAMIDAVHTVTNPVKSVAREAYKKLTNLRSAPDEVEAMDTEVSVSAQDVRKLTVTVNGLKNIMDTLIQHLNAEKGKKKEKHEDIQLLKAKTDLIVKEMAEQNVSAMSESIATGLAETMCLLEDAVSFETSLPSTPESMQQMRKRATELGKHIQKVSLQLGVQGGTIPVAATPMQTSGSDTSQSFVEAAVSQSRMKCEQTSLVMRQALDQYKDANKRTEDANKRMTALVSQIAGYELKEMDFDTMRQTLIQGIHVMGQVKEQWSKLVQYFRMMSNIVECSLQESLTKFIDESESTQELRMKKQGQYSPSKAMRDVLYVQASKANQIAYLVQGLSATYVEVSSKHILQPLAGLDKLMALDADKDKAKIKMYQRSLKQEAESAAEAIKQRVQERHDEIMEKGYERIAKYEKTMREVLPPPSEEEKKELEELREAAAKPLTEPSVDTGGW